MSLGRLQEMETKTTKVSDQVTRGAKAGDPMPTMADPGTQLASVEDLGGPTPENYKPDDDSAKLKEPNLRTVADIVNRGAKKADAMQSMAKEEEEEVLEDGQEIVAEDEVTEEETVEETAEYNVEEDVNALLSGEELSEEFREKAKTIFEAALTAKAEEIKEALEAQYQERVAEEIDSMKVELQERVDSYLEYVADEWLSENQLAVDNGLKSEMTESFLGGMKSLFEEHYVTIPEDKYDVLSNMVEKLDDMETKLNEQIDRNISLNKRLAESVADSILENVSGGLASTQKEKLASLAEGVEFESEESYRGRLETLKESYFTNKTTSQSAQAESLSEGVDDAGASSEGRMSHYLKFLDAAGN